MTAIDNPNGDQTMAELQRQQRQFLAPPPADSNHAGSGVDSVQLGPNADAAGSNSVAIGRDAQATGSDSATAVGEFAWADSDGSTAVGASSFADGTEGTAVGYIARVPFGHNRSSAFGNRAQTTKAGQVRLGVATDEVSVPGTFSNPSARKLKCNITPAPELSGIFPPIYEWEYIARPGRRLIGPMADDFVGTDAERFATFDDAGDVDGLDKCSWHTVQIYALLARVERLEDELRRRNG